MTGQNSFFVGNGGVNLNGVTNNTGNLQLTDVANFRQIPPLRTMA